MLENRNYLQKYAMHFGTYMGIYWILKFILFPLGLSIPFLLFLFVGLTLGVPFMGYYYTKMYRDKICGGEIRFLHAWIFTVFMYMFAALLTAMAHFIYFRFIDQGFVVDTYNAIIDGFLHSDIAGIETYSSQLKDTMNAISSLSPIEITLQLLSQNVFYGSILAVPTALIVMKRKKVA